MGVFPGAPPHRTIATSANEELDPGSLDLLFDADEGSTSWVLPSVVDVRGHAVGYSVLATIRRRAAPMLSIVFRFLPF